MKRLRNGASDDRGHRAGRFPVVTCPSSNWGVWYVSCTLSSTCLLCLCQVCPASLLGGSTNMLKRSLAVAGIACLAIFTAAAPATAQKTKLSVYTALENDQLGP